MTTGGAVRVGPGSEEGEPQATAAHDASDQARWDRLAEVYLAERSGLVRLAALLLDDAAAAEEVVQESFVRLHAQLDRTTNPGGYVRTIVVNRCRSRLRHQAVVARTPVPPPAVQDEPRLPHDADPVWSALQRLPERRRVAVILRFYLDLPDDEIAAALDARPGTVRSLVSRGLASLAKELADDAD